MSWNRGTLHSSEQGNPPDKNDSDDDIAETFGDVKKVDGMDVSMLFENRSYHDFMDHFHDLVKRYKAKTGEYPEYELVFLGEDLGKDETAIVAKLRSLKALCESADGRCVKDVIVKSRNDRFVNLEPNVFSSNIRFELLSD